MQGTKVSSVAYNAVINEFKSLLLPYKRYYISGAIVRPENPVYQVGDYKYNWLLQMDTLVEEFTEPIPPQLPCQIDIHQFKDLHKFADTENYRNIIAVVVHAFPAKHLGDTTARDIVLINQEKKPILLTLWNEFEAENGPQLSSSVATGNIVLAMMVRVSTFYGIATKTITYPQTQQSNVAVAKKILPLKQEFMSFQDLEAGRGAGSRRGFVNGKQDPTQAVASGIFQITTAVSTFQRLVNALGTPKDTPELREKLHKTRLHIGQLVKDTSAKLKQASETDHHAEVSTNKKITDAKLAKDFQLVLKEFQKAQRIAAERETLYTPFSPQAVLPSSYTAGEIDASSDKTPEQRALLVESRRQEVLLLDNEIAFNEAVIEEREQGIQEIQQQIGEVNEIFKDLAVLVHEQGTMIDDIGSNIEGAHAATAQGKSQLVKAAKTQRSNSSLTCLLLVIFGIVLLIVIIVLAAIRDFSFPSFSGSQKTYAGVVSLILHRSAFLSGGGHGPAVVLNCSAHPGSRLVSDAAEG
ncbi:Syntaxin-22 [Striga hermonthica]|uniref:Syntaxin-22 n=1 Tax=Striga hermonthica TaxID=68872 RepID=A0A9N7RU44_STRHE|nr:Syntaxin-22 [Striga hermonthica]